MRDENEYTTRIIQEEPEFLEELSDYLDVLSNSTRLKILKTIEHTPKDVREISSVIQTSYENTKKHLDKLVGLGIVKKEAGLGKPTSKGVHPVWKYSLIQGGLEIIIRNLGLFSNMRISVASEEMNDKLQSVRGMVSEELLGSAPVLVLLGGGDDGKIFPLQQKRVDIGRLDLQREANDVQDEHIVLSESYGAVTRVTKPHGRFFMDDEGWYFEDCGSTGGSYLNNMPLVQGEPAKLRDGDLIELARGVMGARLVIIYPQGKSER